jgi:TPR repeat protein
LENGRGVAKDLGLAAHFYKLSADQGNANAQLRYGFCLENGIGVAQNLGLATDFYKLAADQGNEIAQA